MTGPQITGSVALLEDEYTLVINRGAAAGVTPGMVFAVFSGNGRLVTDPETGRELGRLDEEKLRVKVFEVRELFARAETYSTGVGRPSGTPLAEHPRTYEIPIFTGPAELAQFAGDTLVDEMPTSALSSCEVVTVNVGDAVELVDTRQQ
ncbi:hypothetical protein [Mycolicibacterium komossense]|uniref:Uncharacterized protein n=1 Tax=Mycolicibacterium komossense TaxID=1779 RepID=A0ABT3CEM7_9MYCO|nr:hypothetical protein [Mycolicibacterium komossense]MCV7227942.1 hypothetical protein [Mycolicibacterium komossense]